MYLQVANIWIKEEINHCFCSRLVIQIFLEGFQIFKVPWNIFLPSMILPQRYSKRNGLGSSLRTNFFIKGDFWSTVFIKLMCFHRCSLLQEYQKQLLTSNRERKWTQALLNSSPKWIYKAEIADGCWKWPWLSPRICFFVYKDRDNVYKLRIQISVI